MNFASASFILLFLPAVLIAFHTMRGSLAKDWRMPLLVAASALFYAQSGWRNVAVLAISMVLNFGVARLMVRDAGKERRKALMWSGVLANIGLLLGFKLLILDATSGRGFSSAQDILLPLALSYVTFQQIGLIVAIQRGTVKQVTLPNYLFFVLFFPQLVLGPIVRFEDIDRQLRDNALLNVRAEDVATGIAVFCLALCKKLLIADPLAFAPDAIFAAAEAGPIGAAEAWFAIVAFQLQMFFDFSAYAEMAIGLAMMVGMRVPLNFDRPLFANNRFDLWSRWHISFVTFMRGMVFFPLVRRWRWPVPAALATTGLLSGLWHGLGVTFVIWGVLQTAILLAVHARNQRRRRGGAKALPAALAIGLTFLTTCLIGGLFRSPTLDAAGHIYGGLLGFGGWQGSAIASIDPLRITLLAIAAMLVWLAPDMAQIFRNRWKYTELRGDPSKLPVHRLESRVAFRPSVAWGMICAAALVAALIAVIARDGAARFIYVQF